MRILLLITVSMVLSVLVIFTPALFIHDLKEATALGATILAGLAGVGAIVFGFVIYEDLGIGNKITSRKVDTVIEFLEELKTIQIQAAFYSGDSLRGIMYVTLNRNTRFEDFHRGSNTDSWKDWYVSFLPENYYTGLGKLFKLTSSIWMPSDLVKELAFLAPRSMSSVSGESSYDSRVKIILNGKLELEEKEGEKTWFKLLDSDITFKDYLDSLRNCILVTETWLQKNSRVKLNLNL